MVKRFVLFAGESYYPSGGWNDFFDSFATSNEAQRTGEELLAVNRFDSPDWYQVVDIERGEVLAKKGTPYGEHDG